MFTGIITQIGTIISAEQRGDLRLTIACDWPLESYRIGASIACNGACLTVVAYEKGQFNVTLSQETVHRTAPGQWEKGQKVNLERALTLGDALDGHMVTGHIDGITTIMAITPVGDSHQLTIESPKELAKFIAEKGSVTLNGISLTVNYIAESTFSVTIIPHTWTATNLQTCKVGDKLNLEIDILARYLDRLTRAN